MAGNVVEWTRSLNRGCPYDPNDGRENLYTGEDDRRAVRGGSFADGREGTRCAFHGGYYWRLRLEYLGFRVVVSPISPAP